MRLTSSRIPSRVSCVRSKTVRVSIFVRALGTRCCLCLSRRYYWLLLDRKLLFTIPVVLSGGRTKETLDIDNLINKKVMCDKREGEKIKFRRIFDTHLSILIWIRRIEYFAITLYRVWIACRVIIVEGWIVTPWLS